MNRNRKKILAVICGLLAIGGGVVVANFLGLMTGWFDFAQYEMPVHFAMGADSQEMGIVIAPDGLSFTGTYPYLPDTVITIEEIIAIELNAGHTTANMTFFADGTIGNGPYGSVLRYYLKLYLVNSTHETLVLHWTHETSGAFNDIIAVSNTNVLITENCHLKGELFRNVALSPVSFHIDVYLKAPV
jgi:hypothetical protein